MNLKVMEQKVNATVNGLPEGKLHDAAGSPALPTSNGESRSDGGDEEAAKGKRLSTMQKTALMSLPPPRPIPVCPAYAGAHLRRVPLASRQSYRTLLAGIRLCHCLLLNIFICPCSLQRPRRQRLRCLDGSM